jgi:hypothetical protein
LTGGNPYVILTSNSYLLLFWAGAWRKQPICLGLAQRGRGIGATSRRAGHFSFPVASAVTTARRSPCHHHFGNYLALSFGFNSIHLWSASSFRAHSQRLALPSFNLFGLTHTLCCEARFFFRFFTRLCELLPISIIFAMSSTIQLALSMLF